MYKPLPEPGLKPGPLAPKRMRYHCTTKQTESIDCSPAIEMF